MNLVRRRRVEECGHWFSIGAPVEIEARRSPPYLYQADGGSWKEPPFPLLLGNGVYWSVLAVPVGKVEEAV